MKETDLAIREFQKRCFWDYKTSIGLSEDYRYLYGNPVNVQVPIETAGQAVMIFGAYPSAKFFKVGSVTDVPLMDNDAPFSNERYFDGNRVRSIPSGEELEKKYLTPLEISREQCWITDLVKVFLFKPGHIKRYHQLGETRIPETRSRFSEFARKSIPWLEQEIRIADPKIVILLGLEVTSITFQLSENKVRSYLDGSLRELQMGNISCKAMCLPHPGILMRPSSKNTWPERFETEIRPKAYEELRGVGL